MSGSFWPGDGSQLETVETFVAAFAGLGFLPAQTADLTPDVEKVVVYARSGVSTHMARQLSTGRWTSKLGSGPDIEHELLDLTGGIYGAVAVVLQRPRLDRGPADAGA